MDFRKNIVQQQVGFQMAPLIDIMFLLLIFFMTAVVFAQWETKMGITVPTADEGVRGARLPGEIIVNLDADGRIFINDFERTPAQLEALLAQVAETFQEQPVIIRADGKTHHEKVVQVLDICRKADVWNVAFATLPTKDE